jgi:hypothetical protein
MDSEPVLENRVIKRKRCDIQGCQKSAQGVQRSVSSTAEEDAVWYRDARRVLRGKTDKCIEHGGGRRCLVQGCQKSAKGKTDKCISTRRRKTLFGTGMPEEC